MATANIKSRECKKARKTQTKIDLSEIPECAKPLNDRQRHFCELYVLKYYHCGKYAYQEAYGSTNESTATINACQLINTNNNVRAYIDYLNDLVKKTLVITFEDTVSMQQDALISSMMGAKVDLNGITKTIESLRLALGMTNTNAGKDLVDALTNMFTGVKKQAEEEDNEPTAD